MRTGWGCGKTRLALEAAWQVQLRGGEAWWVSAADEAWLVAEMQAVGRHLGVSDDELRHGEAADLIWRRLAARMGEWLLMIGNAGDLEVLAGPGDSVADGTGWLRPVAPASAGMVMVTSREPDHRHGVYVDGWLSHDMAKSVYKQHAKDPEADASGPVTW